MHTGSSLAHSTLVRIGHLVSIQSGLMGNGHLCGVI